MTPSSVVRRPAAPRRGKVRRAPGKADLVLVGERDAMRVALVLLTLVSIARVHTLVPILSVLRPGVLLTLVCIGLAMSRPQSVVASEFFSTPIVRRVALLFALACIGAPFGVGFRASVTFLTEVILPTLIGAGLIVIGIRNAGDLRLMIASYVGSIGILVYQILFVWGSAEFSGFRRTTSNVMYDANDLGVLLSAGLPLGVLIAQTSKGFPRIAAYVCTLAIPAAIATLGSRGGFLSLILTVVALLAVMPKVTMARRAGIVVASVISILAFAPPGYFTKMQTILDPSDDYNVTSDTGRLAIWKRGLDNLWPNPLTGVGIGNFARAQWARQVYTRTGRPLRAQSPHNTFLQVAVDLGIPAFFVFVSILWCAIVGLLRWRSRLPRSWLEESADRRFIYLATSYLPAAFMGWSAGAFFVSHAYLVPLYILSAFVAGLLYLIRRELRVPARGPAPPRPA